MPSKEPLLPRGGREALRPVGLEPRGAESSPPRSPVLSPPVRQRTTTNPSPPSAWGHNMTVALSKARSHQEEGLRDRLLRFREGGLSGLAIDLFFAFLAVSLCGTYVYTTYQLHAQVWLFVYETTVASLFILDLALRIVLTVPATGVGYVLTSWPFWVSVLTLVPEVPVSFFMSYNSLWFGNEPFYAYIRLLFPVRFIFAYHHVDRVIQSREIGLLNSDFRRQVLSLYMIILCIVLTAAGYFQISENPPDDATVNIDLKYYDALFYVVLTLATIGYPEDVKTPLGKGLVMAFMVVVTVVVPIQISKLLDILSQRSNFSGSYRPWSHKHVVVTGGGDLMTTTESGISHFLDELFHDDHGRPKLQAVLVSPHEPERDMVAYLEDPAHRRRITYIKGSLMNADDQRRAALEEAEACFILADKDNPDREVADAGAIMHCMKIKARTSVPTFVQIMRPANRAHATAAGADHVVCVEELKHNIIATSCLCPGLSTLVCNLMKTTNLRTKRSDPAWLRQYKYGVSNEIYETRLPSWTRGMNFTEAAALIFHNFQAVLIAVVLNGTLCLHPGRYATLDGNEEAYVVCQDKSVADAVASSTGSGRTDPSALSPQMRQALGRSPSFAYSFVEAKEEKQLKDVLMTEVPADWEDHIVVVGPMLGTRHFIIPLRSSHLTSTPRVVWLSDGLPSLREWRSICTFDRVHIVQSSGDMAVDLARVGAQRAKRVAVLASAALPGTNTFADAKNVMYCLELMRQGSDISFLVELKRSESLNVFQSYGQDVAEDYILAPSFAGGSTFSATMLDAVMSNCFYSPHILQIIHSMLSSEEQDTGMYNSHPQLTPLGPDTVGMKFGALLERELAERDALTIALYRKAATEGGEFPYVYGLPKRDEIIQQGDCILALVHSNKIP